MGRQSGEERTWKCEDHNPQQDPKEEEGKRKDLPTTAGRIFYFQMDAGRRISEGKYLPREFERDNSGWHNSR